MDNHSEFLELLSAIADVADFSDEQMTAVSQSMQLEKCEVHEIFIRAEKELEKQNMADENGCVIEISFDVLSAGVEQEIRILNSSYGKESIIEGLRDGTLATSTWHTKSETSTVDVVATGEAIAEVVSQQVNGEYDEFE